MTRRLLIVLILAALPAAGVRAQSQAQMSQQRREQLQEQLEMLPEEVRRVYIDEHAGGFVPKDLTFTDTGGNKVRLGELFKGDVPVILTLNYYRCPRLCDVMLNGTAELVDKLDLEPGADYRLVTVSFDPAESPALARMKRTTLLNTMGRKKAAALNWTFLVGEQPAIDALTEATGFKYTWLEDQKQYAHPAALIVLSPDGKITRYIYGTNFRDRESTVRLSLVEAGEGKVGSPLDLIILTCFHYSPSEGKYTPTVMGIMRIAGAATVLAIAGGIGLLLVREYHRRHARKHAEGEPTGAH